MITLQTLKESQAHVLTLQRLALWFAEQGQNRISTDIQGAALRASKLRAPKETVGADPAPQPRPEHLADASLQRLEAKLKSPKEKAA